MSRNDMKIKRQEKMKHILDIATIEFAAHGFSGVSADALADAAGVSKRSMYYYMGDKETLYNAVIANILVDGESYLKKNKENWDNLELNDKLHGFISALAQIGKHEIYQSIVLRELLAGGGSLPKDFITVSLGQFVDYLNEIIDEGVQRGKFAKINPLLASLMILSTFVYWQITTRHIDNDSKYYNNVEEHGDNVTDSLVDEVHRIFLKLLAAEQ